MAPLTLPAQEKGVVIVLAGFRSPIVTKRGIGALVLPDSKQIAADRDGSFLMAGNAGAGALVLSDPRQIAADRDDFFLSH